MVFLFIYLQDKRVNLSKFNILYWFWRYLFVLGFGVFLKTPLLNIIYHTDISVFSQLCLTMLLSTLLGFICISLFKVVNYIFFCMYNIYIQNRKVNFQLKSSLTGILWLLPVSQVNNLASQYWAKKAWDSQYEIRTLSLVANKLDENSPHPSGISRAAAMNTYLLNKYKQSLEFDRLARYNQYRTMILQTPQFTQNDSTDLPDYETGSGSSSVDLSIF